MVFKAIYTPEEAEQRRKDSRRRYCERNREKIREMGRRYYHEHKEQLKPYKQEVSRRYYWENRDECITKERERRIRRQENKIREKQGLELIPAPPRERKQSVDSPLQSPNTQHHRAREPLCPFSCIQGSFVVEFI